MLTKRPVVKFSSQRDSVFRSNHQNIFDWPFNKKVFGQLSNLALPEEVEIKLISTLLFREIYRDQERFQIDYIFLYRILFYTVRNVQEFTKFLCYKGNVKFVDIHDVFE